MPAGLATDRAAWLTQKLATAMPALHRPSERRNTRRWPRPFAFFRGSAALFWLDFGTSPQFACLAARQRRAPGWSAMRTRKTLVRLPMPAAASSMTSTTDEAGWPTISLMSGDWRRHWSQRCDKNGRFFAHR